MVNAVRFYSKTGNTKKVAEKIAEAAKCKAEPVTAGLNGSVNVLFIGAAVYKMGIDESVIKFINSLNPKHVKRVVIFSTSGLFKKRAYKLVKRALKLKNIRSEKEFFYCKGQLAALNIGKPDEKDLQNAYDFAKNILRK